MRHLIVLAFLALSNAYPLAHYERDVPNTVWKHETPSHQISDFKVFR